jgi:transposase InsO family protein
MFFSIFKDFDFVLVYFDNILFASRTWNEHQQHAQMIVARLNQVNLRIKPTSIKLGYSQLTCLGHLISINGTGVDPKKLEAMEDWPLSKTGADLQSFLGFACFVRQHVRHFADITSPLEAVKHNKLIEWTPELKSAFETTKKAIKNAPFLKFPDFDKPFYIASDASNTGVGGVLYQPNPGSDNISADNIVAICSKKLSKSQQNYSPYKKELWGLVYALRQFHSYVWGRDDLIIYTDHKPLIYMFESENLSQALQMWLDIIQDYTFSVRHRPGILNVIPDALSRMYSGYYEQGVWGIPSNIKFELKESDFMSPVAENAKVLQVSSSKGEELPSAIERSTEMDLAIEMERRGKINPASESKKIELIQQEHAFGHFGRDAIFYKLTNKNYWWPKMRLDISEQLANCDSCSRFVVTKAGFNPANSIIANGPWDHIQIDTSVHLPPSVDGFKALLVIIDVFTGFVILRPIITNSAEIIAKELWLVFCTFGLPKILQSDNGSEFTNKVLRAMSTITGFDHRFIAPYNPRCDGKVEKAIGTVSMIIKKQLQGSEKHWPMYVPGAQLSFNNKISSLTRSTPFSLMFGRSVNEFKDYSNNEEKLINLDDWKSHQEKILSIVYPAIVDRMKISKDKMMESFNKNRKQLLPRSLPNGATVMLIDPIRGNKFEPKYIGPFVIIRRTRNGNYVLSDEVGGLLDRNVPPDQLKLISKKARPTDLNNPIHEVEEILDHRGEASHYEYFVKWKGYLEKTWEPSTNFLDHNIIKKYWNENKNKIGI